MKDCCLWIVIPCYNEEEVLPITAPQFRDEIRSLQEEGLISPNSRILFVDDGSQDKTWDIIEDLAQRMNAFPEYVRAETADIRTLFWQD